MCRIQILSIFLFFFLPKLLSSQLSVDVISGINISRFTQPKTLYKAGFLVGGRLKFYKTSKLKLGASLQFIQNGYKRKCLSPSACVDRKFTRTHANYIELQPFAEYDIKKNFGVILGFNLGILTYQGRYTGRTFFISPNNYGIILGIKYDLNNKYTLSFYRSQGLRDVTASPEQVRSISNQLVLAYKIFAKEKG